MYILCVYLINVGFVHVFYILLLKFKMGDIIVFSIFPGQFDYVLD